VVGDFVEPLGECDPSRLFYPNIGKVVWQMRKWLQMTGTPRIPGRRGVVTVISNAVDILAMLHFRRRL
jgi:hypothetical protein